MRERATAAGVDKVIARAAEAERELRDAFEVERDAFKVQLAELQRKCVAAEMGVRGLQHKNAYLLRTRAPPPDETRHRSPGQRYSDSREATKLQTSPFDDAPARALQFKELPCTPSPSNLPKMAPVAPPTVSPESQEPPPTPKSKPVPQSEAPDDWLAFASPAPGSQKKKRSSKKKKRSEKRRAKKAEAAATRARPAR